MVAFQDEFAGGLFHFGGIDAASGGGFAGGAVEADEARAGGGDFFFDPVELRQAEGAAFGGFEDGELGFAEDEALVDELEERLGRRNVAKIVKHFVPEAGVEQMQHGMLGSADVQINSWRR